MVFVDADRTPESRVRLASDLADRFNATLIGLSALAGPPFTAEGSLVQQVTEADIATLRAKLADRGNWFRALANAGRRKIEWRAAVDFPNAAVPRQARAADLVIVGPPNERADAYRSLDPAEAVLKTGRPTLVVPDTISLLRAEHVVIGWKDAREARRAVQDALPFLHEANRVTIVEVCQPGEEQEAREHLDDVAQYLRRHRIGGGPRVILHSEGREAAQLIRLAEDEGADLLVTGGYGRSRIGEWAFGGVTRDLLTTSPICCLMSH
jgi:nucleotide-binding universal stress UspA family protein